VAAVTSGGSGALKEVEHHPATPATGQIRTAG
jgi:hypothetical protein